MENVGENRRQYNKEFKKNAVQHSLKSEKTIGEVAQDLENLGLQSKGDGMPNIFKNRELVFPGNGKKTHITRKRYQKVNLTGNPRL